MGVVGRARHRRELIADPNFEVSIPNFTWPAAPYNPCMAEIATPIELDGQYRALREEAGLSGRGARRADRPGSRRRRVPAGPAHQRHRGDRARAGLLRRAARSQGTPPVGHAGPASRERRALARSRARPRPGRPQAPAHLQHRPRRRGRGRSERWAITSLIGPRAAELAGFEGLGPEHAQRSREWDGTEVLAVATDVGLDLIDERRSGGEPGGAAAGGGRRRGERAGRRDHPGRVGPAAVRPRHGLRVDARGGRDHRAGRRLREGLLHRPGAGGPAALSGQAEPDPARPAPERPRRARRSAACSATARSARSGPRRLSPALGPIALAIVRREADEGDRLAVGDGGVTAEVVEPPLLP